MVYVILLCGFSGPTSQLAVSVGNRVLLAECVTSVDDLQLNARKHVR